MMFRMPLTVTGVGDHWDVRSAFPVQFDSFPNFINMALPRDVDPAGLWRPAYAVVACDAKWGRDGALFDAIIATIRDAQLAATARR